MAMATPEQQVDVDLQMAGSLQQKTCMLVHHCHQLGGPPGQLHCCGAFWNTCCSIYCQCCPYLHAACSNKIKWRVCQFAACAKIGKNVSNVQVHSM